MQKKDYIAPEVELELFTIGDVITASAGIGDGGNEGGDLDDYNISEEFVDSYIVNKDTGEVEGYMDQYGNEFDQDLLDTIY